MDLECNTFIHRLIESGIRLNDYEDSIVWSWDRVNSMSSVKKTYEAIFDHQPILEHKWWYNLLWHWRLPPKLKVFGWLVLKNRILTGKNLIKRGLFGPFVCSQCKSDEETVNHLFITCPFAQGIWSNIFSRA